MQPAYWHERWRVGQTGFHQPLVEPNLETFWPSLALSAGAQVLVPLCGKSRDLTWLAAQGHHVLGIEYSTIAIENYFLENGIAARRRTAGKFEELSHGSMRILRGDFFDLASDNSSAIEAVYDRAALVALPPEVRRRYAQHLTALIPPATQMLLIALEYPQHQAAGPPFSVLQEEVNLLYGAGFAVELLSREDTLEREPRMRAKGVTEMSQVCYRLRRL
jgi:thiopurine S-methyltransferase